MKINIVVLMAGSGHRFKVAGYEKHKPLIDVVGVPMVQRVIDNLRPKTRDYRFIFVCLKNMVTSELREIFEKEENAYVVELPYITEGAASTALMSMGIAKSNEPLIIAACDQIVDIPIDDFIDYAWTYDGCIMTFKDKELNHSFSIVKDGQVTEVVEKPSKYVSDNANIGIYWFRKSSIYEVAAYGMMHSGSRVNGEWYVAPVYNFFNGKTLIYDVPKQKVHLIGTPKDLEAYVCYLNK